MRKIFIKLSNYNFFLGIVKCVVSEYIFKFNLYFFLYIINLKLKYLFVCWMLYLKVIGFLNFISICLDFFLVLIC